MSREIIGTEVPLDHDVETLTVVMHSNGERHEVIFAGTSNPIVKHFTLTEHGAKVLLELATHLVEPCCVHEVLLDGIPDELLPEDASELDRP